MSKHKAGIVCDNYKVKFFEKGLREAGYTDFITIPFTGKLANNTNITVIYPEEKLKDLTRVIKLLNINYKNRN